jgi:eukaryotic-like serine/threonine-protein kinase
VTPDQYQQVKEIFHAALELNSDERAEFLSRACNGDNTIRDEVDSLLAHQPQAENFIESSAFELGARLLSGSELDTLKGRRIGQYELIDELGHGGMGAVYLAARADDQFKKQVAIKIVRRGLDTRETRSRFRHERQILASLDHPNIAKLLDGGATDDGLPYLVMDYIEGLPITEYCDKHSLTINQRLNLFRTVCSAVHYAHQRLIIHRDLKPGNILVSSDGTPRLLDFGIAKLIDTTSEKGLTGTDVRLMTPEYASPEQVLGHEVTTVSDVYALGVLLYQLLTGQKPYRITSSRPDAIARAICDQQPERPSEAVDNGKLLRGDLDNIVLKAMQKEPERRYTSVEQFSEDIRRHVEGLPVSARKDTLTYRSLKFVRRHRVGVAAAAVVIVTLISAIVATAWQARVAARERDTARLEKAKAERVNAFLQEMLSSADPLKKGYSVKASDLLADAARRAQIDLASQPEMQAEVLRTIGNTYSGLGLLAEAEPLLRQALETHRRLYGSQHRETARSMHDLAQMLRGKGDFDNSEKLFREALAAEGSISPQGDIATANTLLYLSVVQGQHGNTDEAEKTANQSLQLSQKLGDEGRTVARLALNQLGLVKEYRGDLAGAEQLYRQAIEMYKSSASQSAEMSLVLMNLATNLTSQQKYDEAETIFLEALDHSRRLFGEAHPNVAIIMTHYSRMEYLKGDYASAETKLRTAVEIERKTLPAGHPESAQTLVTLGIVLVRAGKPAEGEPYLREALSIRQTSQPPGHWSTANVKSMLGECLVAEKRFAEAEPLLKQGYEEIKAALGQKHPRTHEALVRLPQLYDAWKKPDLAARYRALL